MGIDTLVAKIAFAGIFGIFLLWIVRPAISVIGMIPASGNMNPFIVAFLLVVVPIACVFIGVYKIIGVFTSKGRY